jgi:hypothetical protein
VPYIWRRTIQKMFICIRSILLISGLTVLEGLLQKRRMNAAKMNQEYDAVQTVESLVEF